MRLTILLLVKLISTLLLCLMHLNLSLTKISGLLVKVWNLFIISKDSVSPLKLYFYSLLFSSFVLIIFVGMKRTFYNGKNGTVRKKLKLLIYLRLLKNCLNSTDCFCYVLCVRIDCLLRWVNLCMTRWVRDTLNNLLLILSKRFKKLLRLCLYFSCCSLVLTLHLTLRELLRLSIFPRITDVLSTFLWAKVRKTERRKLCLTVLKKVIGLCFKTCIWCKVGCTVWMDWKDI